MISQKDIDNLAKAFLFKLRARSPEQVSRYYDDLFQECRLAGFLKAHKHDSSRGKPSTFLTYVFRSAVQNFFHHGSAAKDAKYSALPEEGPVHESLCQAPPEFFPSELAKVRKRYRRAVRNAVVKTQERSTVRSDTRSPSDIIDILERHLDGEKMSDIGASLGITRSRVQQLVKKYHDAAIEKIGDRP
jgi:DNA-directed RNA polymerase specialized sigma24 family protein